MKSRALVAALLVVGFAGSVVLAGEPAQKMDPKAKMEMMKTEMMKCAVCKNMATHLDELGPVMSMEVVKMDNGMAMMHSVSDPAKVALFHADHDATAKAGESCMTMTDEQAKTQLCAFCQEIRSAMKSGAQMSSGKTKAGDIMVLSSTDPKVQTKLSELHTKCEMMMAGM